MQPDKGRDLDRELRGLGPHVEYPPTPDLAGPVRGRLDAEAGRPVSPVRSGPSLWWIAAAALMVLVAVPVFSLALRGGMGAGGMAGGSAQGGGDAVSPGEQVADGGSETANEPTTYAREKQADSAAGASASVSSGASALDGQAPSVTPGGRRILGEDLGLGERVALREVHARSEAPILLPRSPRLGKPDEVYDRAGAPGFTFLYPARYYGGPPGLPPLDDTRIGLLVSQTPGDAGAAYLPDGVTETAELQAVSVNGEEGFWSPASGDSPQVVRSAGLLSDVLLWERDGQALRIEANVSKEEAVRIAESVR